LAGRRTVRNRLLWLGDQVLEPGDLLHQSFLRELHRRMFSAVWTWAGKLRQRDTTICVQPSRIQEELQVLLGDAAFWIEQETFGSSEICVRFHHRLVFIHPFVNGNGRHARLTAGALADSRRRLLRSPHQRCQLIVRPKSEYVGVPVVRDCWARDRRRAMEGRRWGVASARVR
jgi:Fic-DOC domain mobile mystery protein B